MKVVASSVLLLCLLAVTLCCRRAAQPEIDHRYAIDYTPRRIELLKGYARAHYSDYYLKTTGSAEMPGIEIDPKVIVVHYTAVPTLEGTLRVFAPDTLQGRPELDSAGKANVGVQFVVDRDGTIYPLTPDNYFCRHCIGLNHCAIGFENVGTDDISEAGLSGEAQEGELTLQQLRSNVLLIRSLKNKYPGIEILIGHSEYRQLEEPSHPGHKYFHENDPGYRTVKSDPGPRFLSALRSEIKDILKEGSAGQVFK